MNATGFAFGKLTVLLGLVGGLGLPLGTPPLPEDPMMAKMAPEECLAYISSAGMATPDPKSVNQTEQLLAEPEVQTMAADLERAVRAGLGRSAGRGRLPPGLTSDDIVDAVKLLLTRPLTVYVSNVQMQPPRPTIRGGIAINLGQDAAKIKAKIESFVKTLPEQAEEFEMGGAIWQRLVAAPNLTIDWIFHEQHLLVAVGEGEAEAMLKRAQGNPPKWLAQLREQLPVERPSTVTYFNLKAIMGLAMPLAGPGAAEHIQALGFGNVTALASVSGFDQKACVNKTLLSIDGEPEGILRLANAKPLTPADLAAVPQDATFALAFKLNLESLFDTIQNTVGKSDPHARDAMLRAMGELQARLGLKIPDDLIKPLGDTWCIFDSPNEGGMLSGLTLVVSLKDAKQAASTQARLVPQLTQRGNVAVGRDADPRIVQQWSKWRDRPGIEKVDFAGKEIYVFNGDGSRSVVAPSWCLTDKELIVALFPQSIKAYLSRPADFKSLAQSPEIAKVFEGGSAPFKMVYCDSQRVFDLLYPIALAAVDAMRNRLRMEGIDLGALFLPSARAIRGHLSPAVTMVRRTTAGIEVVEKCTLPGVNMAVAAPVGIAMLVPAVSGLRESARQQAQSTNQMKQIGLAMHNYAYAHKTFPPAYKSDKDGKPLLSWRVLILTFLDEDRLYRQFHLDEPWDSEHNKQLIAAMPRAYKSPNSKVSGAWKTNYLTVRGEKTMFPGKKAIGPPEIGDGLSNTIMTVEVSDDKAVIWSKPDDFEYDEANPLKGLVGQWPNVFIAGLADGSVRFLPSSISPKTLKALFTRSGGEVVDWSELDR